MADMIALVIMGQRKRTGLLADKPDAGVSCQVPAVLLSSFMIDANTPFNRR